MLFALKRTPEFFFMTAFFGAFARNGAFLVADFLVVGAGFLTAFLTTFFAAFLVAIMTATIAEIQKMSRS